MNRTRRARGLSAVEILISAVFAFGLLSGAVSMAASSADLARGSAAEDAVARRVTVALAAVTDEIRVSSLGAVRQPDGSAFATGTTASGISLRSVVGYRGSLQLGDVTTLRFDLPAGAEEGELIRASGGVEEVLARGVTAFSVTRDGGAFTVTIAARTGDRSARRTAGGSLTVRTRNP